MCSSDRPHTYTYTHARMHHIYSIQVYFPHIHTKAQHALRMWLWSYEFLHHHFVNKCFVWEAGGLPGMNKKKREGKYGFDLEFREKIHQDLLNRCICQACGDTQSGLHNHILWMKKGVWACIFLCMYTAIALVAKGENNIYIHFWSTSDFFNTQQNKKRFVKCLL